MTGKNGTSPSAVKTVRLDRMLRAGFVLLGAVALSGCGRLEERRQARMETQQAGLMTAPDLPAAHAALQEETQDPAGQNTPALTVGAEEALAVVQALDSMLGELEGELQWDESTLAEAAADYSLMEIDSLLQQLENQESRAETLEDLP